MNLIDVHKEFKTEAECIAYLVTMRWPGGVRCLRCDGAKVSKFITKETTRERINRKKKRVTVRVPARHLFECLSCGYQFAATTGTIFHDTHLPLQQWFMAIALVVDAKKGISANQMKRHLRVQYRTAWHLCHRIRKAMEEPEQPKLKGIVEVDETYLGGKFDRRRKRNRWEKAPIMGMVERGGRVEARHILTPSKMILTGIVKDRVAPEAEMVCTDENRAYLSLKKTYRHEVINHIREYVRGNIHTNTIENFWSLFKRGVIGSFHKVSVKHLPRYLAEFTYRFNHRQDGDLFSKTLGNLLFGKALPYRELVNGQAPPV